MEEPGRKITGDRGGRLLQVLLQKGQPGRPEDPNHKQKQCTYNCSELEMEENPGHSPQHGKWPASAFFPGHSEQRSPEKVKTLSYADTLVGVEKRP
jgi:hypothetical protein